MQDVADRALQPESTPPGRGHLSTCHDALARRLPQSAPSRLACCRITTRATELRSVVPPGSLRTPALQDRLQVGTASRAEATGLACDAGSPVRALSACQDLYRRAAMVARLVRVIFDQTNANGCGGGFVLTGDFGTMRPSATSNRVCVRTAWLAHRMWPLLGRDLRTRRRGRDDCSGSSLPTARQSAVGRTDPRAAGRFCQRGRLTCR